MVSSGAMSHRKVVDLTDEEFFALIRNAVAHGIADQLGQPIADTRQIAQLVELISKNGVKPKGGIATGVFGGLLLWSILPAVLMFFALVLGIGFAR